MSKANVYVVVKGSKFWVYRDRKVLEADGQLNFEPGTNGRSLSMDLLALSGEVFAARPLGRYPVVLQVLNGGT